MTLLFILWVLRILCMLTFLLFRTPCLFKKECSRKECPFRDKTLPCDFHFDSNLFYANCHKCPYPFDAEEEKELRESLENLLNMIGQ